VGWVLGASGPFFFRRAMDGEGDSNKSANRSSHVAMTTSI